ncbi:MAG: hypothetical protein OXC12_12280 [Spirochaetaceae bacterium]|nr:hypothetical protein [Spirochaetaceae bacterium]
MPRFSIRQPTEVKEKGVTKALVEKYEKYIGRIEGAAVGQLTFRESEDINQAREALRAAADKQGVDLIIRRPRGVDNRLEFRRRTG